MAASAGATAAVVASMHSSSYRVKFNRREFLELVEIAKPRIIYHVRRIFFFAFDGFLIYTFECAHRDFDQMIIEAIEFSNQQWSE